MIISKSILDLNLDGTRFVFQFSCVRVYPSTLSGVPFSSPTDESGTEAKSKETLVVVKKDLRQTGVWVDWSKVPKFRKSKVQPKNFMIVYYSPVSISRESLLDPVPRLTIVHLT